MINRAYPSVFSHSRKANFLEELAWKFLGKKSEHLNK